MDQQARQRGGCSLNSNTGCLIRLDRLRRRWTERLAAVGLAAGLGLGVLAAGALAGLAALRGPQILDYARENTAFFAVAGLLALSALVLLGALTSVLSRRT